MKRTEKTNPPQTKSGVMTDSLGITQSSGLDRPAVYVIENHPQDSRVKICEDGIVQTLSGKMGTGGGNVPLILETQQEETHG